MAGFRGQRLALWDDLSYGRKVTAGDVSRWSLQEQERLSWLVYHRLAWLDTDAGTFHARGVGEARVQWDTIGACKEAARIFSELPKPAAGPVPAPAPQPERRAVHAHQQDLFA
ncbi:MAG TPA: hypothetical protein VG838_00625 [Opitutaceae bacterium]|nr:hypothetical protein [Opitutaceae bacterium]